MNQIQKEVSIPTTNATAAEARYILRWFYCLLEPSLTLITCFFKLSLINIALQACLPFI